jgi:hypothetical protein
MKAKSIKGNSTDEIREALNQALRDGFKPTLAILFISIKMDRHAVCEILQQEGIDFLGATSCGEFINGYQSEGAGVMLLLDLPRESYTILFENIGDRDIRDISIRLAQSALNKFKKPAFILCSTGVSDQGVLFRGDVLLQSLALVVGPHVQIYGGMAGDDGSFTGSYVFTEDKETDIGVAALVLDEDKISMHGMAISGWKPLGLARTVTKSENGWLYTIDDQPALEMYLRYLGKEATTDEDKYKMFEDIGVHYPFQVENSGDPVMRTPFLINSEEDAIKLDFDVPAGTKLRFSTPPDFDIVENVLEKANELKDTIQSGAEAMLIFSCAGSISALGPLTTLENDGLSDLWKAPMAGFFTYGEYGTDKGRKQEFHSTTCCWVVLNEK